VLKLHHEYFCLTFSVLIGLSYILQEGFPWPQRWS